MKEHGEMSVERRSRGYISCWTDVLLKFVAGIRLFSSALSLLAHIINVNRHVSQRVQDIHEHRLRSPNWSSGQLQALDTIILPDRPAEAILTTLTVMAELLLKSSDFIEFGT